MKKTIKALLFLMLFIPFISIKAEEIKEVNITLGLLPCEGETYGDYKEFATKHLNENIGWLGEISVYDDYGDWLWSSHEFEAGTKYYIHFYINLNKGNNYLSDNSKVNITTADGVKVAQRNYDVRDEYDYYIEYTIPTSGACERHTLTFNHDEDDVEVKKINSGLSFILEGDYDTYAGKKFTGYKCGETTYTSFPTSVKVTKDMTFNSQFVDVNTYNLNYYIDGKLYKTEKMNEGEPIFYFVDYYVEDEDTGYNAYDWYMDPEFKTEMYEELRGKKVTKDLNIYSYWVNYL